MTPDSRWSIAYSESSADYLGRLADEAAEWFDQSRDSPEALALRLDQMRAGCARLLEAPHEPLEPVDRAWLLERCKAWSGKFETQRADLRGKRKGIAEVRGEADATVRQLIAALRKRAQSVG